MKDTACSYVRVTKSPCSKTCPVFFIISLTLHEELNKNCN